MKTRSRKNKGRRLQNYVRDRILDTFKALSKNDVRSTGMGQSGADIQLSALAQLEFPFYVECKNWESLRTIQGLYEHTEDMCIKENGLNPLPITPILVIKSNKNKPLVLIDFEDFMLLLNRGALGAKGDNKTN